MTQVNHLEQERAKSKTTALVQSALLVAFLALSAQISLQLGPIPFTLQTAVVALTALLMKPRQAAFIMAIYLLIGAIGLPVFSGGKSGLAGLMGPSGGFLWGFVIACALGSFVRVHIQKPEGQSLLRELIGDICCVLIVMAVSYVCGLIQLMFVAHLDLMAAFLAAVAPFIVFDIAKCALAIVVALAIRKALGGLES